MNLSRYCVAALLGFTVIAAGCGGGAPKAEPGIVVTAKIVQGGNVIQTAVPGGTIQVNFVRLNENGTTAEIFHADYGADGSVKIVGGGKGVTPGTYKLTITESGMYDPINPSADNKDMFGNRFTLPTTPYQFDIPADKVGGTHDLGTLDLADPPKAPAAKPPGT